MGSRVYHRHLSDQRACAILILRVSFTGLGSAALHIKTFLSTYYTHSTYLPEELAWVDTVADIFTVLINSRDVDSHESGQALGDGFLWLVCD
jgi:hypothetical protein